MIALIGLGKTGLQVSELLSESQTKHITFDSKTPLSLEALKNIKRAIIFLPPKAFMDVFDILHRSDLEILIIGTTGIEVEKLHIINPHQKWIFSSNFSPMMPFIQKALKHLGAFLHLQMQQREEDFSKLIKTSIHEIHHTSKVDSPSGTAIKWKEWIRAALDEKDAKISISSDRIEDIHGVHQLKIETPFEELTFSHQAKDRKLFAQGAIDALKLVEGLKDLRPGLYHYEDLIEKQLHNT